MRARSAGRSSSADSTIRMPRPPPPAAALIISGKPIPSAWRRASASVTTGPPLHAATGTPTSSASSLAAILSPSRRIASGGGPMNVTPIRSHSSANAGSSATKPHPTQAKSAWQVRSARSSSAWSMYGFPAPPALDDDRLVRLADERGVRLLGRVERHRPQRPAPLVVQLAGGVDEPPGGLTPVHDRDARVHGPTLTGAPRPRYGACRTYGIRVPTAPGVTRLASSSGSRRQQREHADGKAVRHQPARATRLPVELPRRPRLQRDRDRGAALGRRAARLRGEGADGRGDHGARPRPAGTGPASSCCGTLRSTCSGRTGTP